jgi:hypothetical protein
MTNTVTHKTQNIRQFHAISNIKSDNKLKNEKYFIKKLRDLNIMFIFAAVNSEFILNFPSSQRFVIPNTDTSFTGLHHY